MLKEKRQSLLATTGLWLVASIWFCGETMAVGWTPVALEQKELLEVKVHQLLKDPTSKQPVVFLVDPLEERALLIWISFFEADAIHSEMQGIKRRRPLTHDLLEKIIQKMNGKIHRIVITHIEEGIFYATIVLEKGGSFLEIDARPSDSIVMALKFKAPIFVSKDLFKEMAIPLGGQEEIDKQYGLTIQALTPSLAQVFSFPETHGVLISDVRKGSDAEKDGIKRGDIFVEVGGRAVEDVTIMKDALATSNTPVEAKIFRKTHFLKITLHPK